jgi:hypothetical protein
VTVLDRFLTAGVSRESFDECLVAAQIAMGGQRSAVRLRPRVL